MITFDLPLPPSVNRLRRVDFKYAKLLKAWQAQADNLVYVQKRGPLKQLGVPVEIHIVLRDQKRGDLDNFCKALVDYCVYLRLIPDDKPFWVRRIVMEFGEAPEGARITLKPWRLPLPFVTGARRRAMLEYVANHPNGVNCRQILDHVYADDPDGGPLTHHIVSTMARAINEQIKPQGWRINITGGPGSLYTLVPTEQHTTSPSDPPPWVDSSVKAGP